QQDDITLACIRIVRPCRHSCGAAYGFSLWTTPMPLPQPANRKEVHQRTIDMKAYERDDGMFDVEAHLVDTKPLEFERVGMSAPDLTGTPLYDFCVSLPLDQEFVARAICASSDVMPLGICMQAETSL